ncbi:MAG: MFS transporter [candidate division WOR-3 bacterium]
MTGRLYPEWFLISMRRYAIARIKFWNILKIRDFSIFLFSQTISQFGDKLDYIALIALIGLFPKERTPLLLSQLALFITLPVLLFGPIAGVLVDRWHKKKVMVICDTLRMLCAFSLPITFLYTKNIYPVFAIVFFMFLLALFFNAARSAIIPNLVSKKRLLTANSILNLVGRGATFLGMATGGLIIDWPLWKNVFGIAGWIVAFIIDGITFGISAVMLYIMKVNLKEKIKMKEETHLQPKSLFLMLKDSLAKILKEIAFALAHIIKKKNLCFAMATIFLMIVAGSVVYVLAIPTIQQDMAWGTRGVGVLAAVGAVGLLLGAYLAGTLGHYFDLRRFIIYCFILISAGLFFFPFIHEFYQFIIIALLVGIAASPIFIGQDTLIHQYADEEVRGRIFSFRDWLLNLTFVVGALIVGSLSSFLTKKYLFIIFGGIILGASITFWVLITRIRDAESPAIS